MDLVSSGDLSSKYQEWYSDIVIAKEKLCQEKIIIPLPVEKKYWKS